MSPLHFGHFAGVLSKAVWCALGVAMCYVILSGSGSRRSAGPTTAVAGVRRGGAGRRLGPSDRDAGFRLVLFPVAAGGDAFWWTPASFLVGAVLAVLVALAVAEQERLALAYRRLLGLGCLGLPVWPGGGRHGLGRGGPDAPSTTC